MAGVISFPKKRRTRGHVIADLSVNHVERFILEAGFVAEPVARDYGYDLRVTTFDAGGYLEPGQILFQLKAAERLKANRAGTAFAFDLSVSDYNAWMEEPMPVFLILYDASSRWAYWQYVQRYFRAEPAKKPRAAASFVRVAVPVSHRVGRKMVVMVRQCKDNILRQQKGRIDHA
jgi:hypothetical protein